MTILVASVFRKLRVESLLLRDFKTTTVRRSNESTRAIKSMSAGNPTVKLSGMQKAVRWYPPAYNICVEDVLIPW